MMILFLSCTSSELSFDFGDDTAPVTQEPTSQPESQPEQNPNSGITFYNDIRPILDQAIKPGFDMPPNRNWNKIGSRAQKE